MILGDVITDVRRLIQDEDSTRYRYSDTFILNMANQALKRIALMRPDLFAYLGTVNCVQGEVVQDAPSDSIRIIEVYSIVGGNGLVEANREVLDQTAPSWVNDAEGPAVNWMRHVRNPNKFFIYPQAPAAQVLNVEYAQSPPTYDAATAVALLPDAYFPVVVDATTFLVESVDNENITNGRAKIFQDSFTQALGIATQTRPITDTETSGLKTEEVV